MNYIGRYKLDTKLGEGTLGIVYRAYDPVLDRRVAIKSIKARELRDDQIKQSLKEFRHEAKIAGKYTHENIVAIHDVIHQDGLDYMVMEYVPGCSILEYMFSVDNMEIEEILSVAYQSCLGLAYIHYHGVIHRDIKPANILYYPANRIAKITDFSIAQKIEEQPSANYGTIAYMAPEHFDDTRKITPLTDIFALGSSIYRMLTKKYPFSNKNTAYQILQEPAVPIKESRSDVPVSVEYLVDKAMAKADRDRFQSAAEFATAIEHTFKQLFPNSPLLELSKDYLVA